jgi:phosphoenolpyruvate carboxykinase (ATP)
MGNLSVLSVAELLKALADGTQVHKNLPVAQLIETALKRGEATLAANGALLAVTGARTGRSPKDKFIVDDEATHALVHWGKVNQPFSPERFDALLERVVEHLRGRELFEQDLYCGADPAYRMPIRVIAEYAWHALFVRRSSRPCRSATGPRAEPSSWPISRARSCSLAAPSMPAR